MKRHEIHACFPLRCAALVANIGRLNNIPSVKVVSVMRLTILSSVSVLALLSLTPFQAFSAFEFVAPRPATEATEITESKSAGPVIAAPTVQTDHLPLPTVSNSAADLVKNAINPAMDGADASFGGGKPIPLTPVAHDSDSLVVDTRTARIKTDVQELPPLPSARASKPVAAVPASIMPTPVMPVPVMPEPAPIAASYRAPDDDLPVSSFGVVPMMPSSSSFAPASHNDAEVVEGFGRDVPLVLALQQIVPTHYRYSFDDAISPGTRISWTGGQPWKDVIMDIAQRNNMNVDIVSNVVAFHRGGSSSAPSASAFAGMPSAAGFSAVDSAPVMPIPTMPAPHDIQPVRSAPLPIVQEEIAAPVVERKAPVVAPVAVKASKDAAFDPLLADNVPAKQKVENKRILTAEPAPAMPAPVMANNPPSSFDMPMPIAPIADAAPVAAPMITEVPRSSSQPVAEAGNEVVSPPSYVATDIASSREWAAMKGETLRQALTNWSQGAGVSLVWSSEYDYPLQTDVRIAASYADAVRTLLAGFSKAQPRPLGRLFDNQKSGAQPVLIIETQRLTN